MSSGDPIFFVTVFANKLPFDVSDRILSLTYEDNEAKADKLTLKVDNFDLSNFDLPIFKGGNKVEASWGYPGRMSPPRLLTIASVKGSIELAIEAKGAHLDMNRLMKIRTFEGPIKRSDVAMKLALEEGFQASQIFIDDTKILFPQIQQPRMTNAQLCRDMAKREGFEFYLDFDGFHFHPRRLGQIPVRRFFYYRDSANSDIISWNVENDIFQAKAGQITAQGVDPLTGQPHSTDANNANNSGQTALAPEKEIFAGVGASDGTITVSEHQVDSGTTHTVRSTEASQPAAARTANGLWAKNQLMNVELAFVAAGDPLLVAKTIVEIHNIGMTISGNYYLKSITHKVGPGYEMDCKARRDGKSATNLADLQTQVATQTGIAAAPVPPAGPQNDQKTPDGKDPKPALSVGAQDGSFTFNDSYGRDNNASVPGQTVDPNFQSSILFNSGPGR